MGKRRPASTKVGHRQCNCGRSMVVCRIDTGMDGTVPVDLALCDVCDRVGKGGY